MKTLTNEQLCALAQAGDAEAAEALIEQNRRYIQQLVTKLTSNPIRSERFAFWGIELDDLVQAGLIGLWKAIDGYDSMKESKFLTYADHVIDSHMSDLIRQYSRDTVWHLQTDKANTWKIVCLDEPVDDVSEDTVESLIASPDAKLPEQICIEQETMAELHEAMDMLPERESAYVQYQFGFTDSEVHPLTETAQHFRLTESRAKGVERSALKLLKHALLIGIPERAFIKAVDQLTRILVEDGELHSVELRLKSQKKRGRKITAAVYKYLADCDGKWGELRYNFKDDIAEILLLAEWDTIVSHRFAMRAVEYIKTLCIDKIPDKIMLTFIGPEQRATTMTINLKQVIDAVESANEVHTALYDTQTDKTV